MQDENTEPPKIIIDEDWKSQVEREKSQSVPSANQTPSSEKRASTSPTENTDEGLPDANFPMLVTMLATQALAALGKLPSADGETPAVQKSVAKHFIDLLGVLEAKTEGNLTNDEAKMLREILHNLRMTFVQA